MLKVGMIGYRFMGKAHSHAWKDVAMFFDVPAPALQVICGRDRAGLESAAAQYGWAETSTNWRSVVESPDIDLIDICTPNYNHAEIAIAAAMAGKHILCEKPLAMNLTEAKAMMAAVEQAGVIAMVSHNYRFAPAVRLARQLIAEGRLGQVYHVRGQYLQDWIMDPEFPAVWRLQKATTGSGALGDIGSHVLDLARFLVGEITDVTATLRTFIEERPTDDSGQGAWGATGGASRVKVDVDDAMGCLVRFENGAMGVFEATRFAAGNRNRNRFEISGSRGSVRWDLENMNILEVYFSEDSAGVQGWRSINVTEAVHPYMKHWWPPGHIIGYEHTFVHLIYELLAGIGRGENPAPSFRDAAGTQAVLAAVEESAGNGRWVTVEKV